MEQEVAKRKGGRPLGSKTKKINLSGASIERICEYHKFNPVEKLIRIANRCDDIAWPPALEFAATAKLVEGIYGKRQAIPGLSDGGPIDGQFSLVFVEDGAPFTLPGQADAEGTAPVVQPEPIQRLSDSSQSW